MLILFDIDGTLLLTRGAGIMAMQDAMKELTGREHSVDGLEFSGCLDHLIWKDICQRNQTETTDELHDSFRERYHFHLNRRFDTDATSSALPGATELMQALTEDTRNTLGLVTGNYPETGRLKIERANIDYAAFKVFGWATDGQHRRDLPVAATTQFNEQSPSPIDPHEVIIIGDTPHDIDCAHHNNHRVLAVTTGKFTHDQLSDADWVVDDLSNTEHLMDTVFA